MPAHDSQPSQEIASAAKVLGIQLIERLTSIPDYNAELASLITLLCQRPGKGEAEACYRQPRIDPVTEILLTQAPIL